MIQPQREVCTVTDMHANIKIKADILAGDV
jgi:hypothetical protein